MRVTNRNIIWCVIEIYLKRGDEDNWISNFECTAIFYLWSSMSITRECFHQSEFLTRFLFLPSYGVNGIKLGI